MSKYTTEVRYICEVNAGLTDSAGFNSIDSVLDKCVDKIFDFDYPIFDEAYRRPLNKKILRHFYTREICEETVGLWKLRLQQTLNEIMPYYNKLYTSEIKEINPYYNVDITTERSTVGDKNGTSNDSNTINTNMTGHSSEYGQGTQNKTGTNKDDYTNTLDRTNTGDDTVTKTTNGSTKEKDVKTTKYVDHHRGSEAGRREVNTDKTTTLNEVTNSTDRYSDTPQGGINGMTAIDSDMYLTNARLINTPHSATTNDKGKAKDNYEQTKGSDNYTNDGNGSEKLNKTGQNTETEKTSGKNNLKTKETGKKNGTSTLNENTTKSDNKSKSEESDTSRKELKSGKTTLSSTEEYLEHVYGYKGNKSYVELLMEWRKSFLNIDAMILKDLATCFFQLW